ncbi:MAG: hypothetical protein B7Z30_15225 [Rhizobiales bacterium 12-68-15]|nr:MAG: hypothetical protein B7Z30_15225 [Rhizobiales bacterium 12-68-15]
MAKLFDQFTRYLTCYVLIHNYYAWRNAGGPLPTLSLLQPAVEASPRQTAGFIASLKAGRLVTVESADGDRRSKLLRPAPEMIREIGRSVQAFVAAGEALETLGTQESMPSLSYRALAERLQVSPAHIGNLLGEADRNGWFTIGARGRLVAMDPGLVAEFEVWAACQIAHFAGLSRQTAAFLEQGAGGAAPLMTGPAS